MRQPALLLLDEPTAGLGAGYTRLLVRLLRCVTAGGRALVLAEHRGSVITPPPDGVTILDHGEAVAEGTPAKLAKAWPQELGNVARKDESDYIIQSVSHALDLLGELRGETDELGVTELSKKLELDKNNVFRLLAALESRGYIEQNKATETYRLGLKSLKLGQTLIDQMGLLRWIGLLVASWLRHGHAAGQYSIAVPPSHG